MTAPEEGRKRGPSSWNIGLGMAVLCVIWGSTYLVIRESLRDLPPFTSAGIRFAVAGGLLALFGPAMARREGGVKPTLTLTLTMGVFNVALAYGIVYWSETILPSGLVSVLWSVYPLFVALSGHLFLPNERLRPRQWLGFLVGFGGVAVLFATDLRAIGPEAIPAGLILLLSPAFVTVGTTIIKRTGGGTSSILLNRNGMILGSILLLGFGAITEPNVRMNWTPRAIASVGYLVIMGTIVTFSLYYWLMRYAAATKLSLVAYVIPVVALTLGTVFAGEPFGSATLVGSGIVLLGLAFVHWPHKEGEGGVAD